MNIISINSHRKEEITNIILHSIYEPFVINKVINKFISMGLLLKKKTCKNACPTTTL